MSNAPPSNTEKYHTPRAKAFLHHVLNDNHPNTDTRISKLGLYNARTIEIRARLEGQVEHITASDVELFAEFRTYLQQIFNMNCLPLMTLELTGSDYEPWLSLMVSPFRDGKRLITSLGPLLVDEHNFEAVMRTFRAKEREEKVLVFRASGGAEGG